MMRRRIFVIRYRWWIIGFTILLCLLCILPLLNNRVNSDLESYLPDSMTSKKNNNRIEDIFGKDDPLILVFSVDDVLNEATLQRIQALSREFNRMRRFDMVMSLFDASRLKGDSISMTTEPVIRRIPRSFEAREELRVKMQNDDHIYGQLVSKDFKHTLIILNGSKLGTDEVLMDSVQSVLKRHPGSETLNLFGQPYLRDEANHKVFHDLIFLLPLGLLVMFLFLWISFRDIRMVWLPFSVVLIAIVLALALIPLFGWELSIIGVLVPIMMIAIANNYGIHVVTRNQELDQQYQKTHRNRIVTNLVLFLRKPVLFTGLTTIVGIGSLLMHILKPARQMGIVSAIGIAFALFFSLTFIPAIISLSPRRETGKVKRRNGQVHNTGILSGIAAFIVRRPKWIIMSFSIVFVTSLIFLPRLRVAPDFNNIFPASHAFNRALDIIDTEFGGTRTINLMIEGDIKDPVLLKKMDKMEEEIKRMSEVGSVHSISTIIRMISKAMNAPDHPEYDRVPDRRDLVAQYMTMYESEGDPEDLEQFVDFDYTRAVMSIQYKADNIKTVNKLADRISDISREQDLKVVIGGYSLVEKELSMAVTIGQKNSLIFAFILISILLIIIFRSIPAGLLGSLPLLFAVICTFGIMCITGTELNIITALLSSISIGLGVDYTIHIFWRLKAELARSASMEEAVVAGITSTGRGITINALSVMAGFSVLMFSAFPMIRSFSFLIIASVGFCLLCAMFLIPAICLVSRPRFLWKKNRI